MKAKKLYFVIFIYLIFISTCSSRDLVDNDDKKTDKAISNEIIRKDLDKRENTGKIEVSGDDVYYVVNWASKSRKTFKVIGNLKEEIKKLKDKIIEAEGKITYESTWTGTIEIESYKIKE